MQVAPAAKEAPDSDIELEPAIAVVVPGGVQVSTRPLAGLATVNPVGRVSVNEIQVTTRLAFGFVNVN